LSETIEFKTWPAERWPETCRQAGFPDWAPQSPAALFGGDERIFFENQSRPEEIAALLERIPFWAVSLAGDWVLWSKTTPGEVLSYSWFHTGQGTEYYVKRVATVWDASLRHGDLSSQLAKISWDRVWVMLEPGLFDPIFQLFARLEVEVPPGEAQAERLSVIHTYRRAKTLTMFGGHQLAHAKEGVSEALIGCAKHGLHIAHRLGVSQIPDQTIRESVGPSSFRVNSTRLAEMVSSLPESDWAVIDALKPPPPRIRKQLPA
jgi:hypothetical protein